MPEHSATNAGEFARVQETRRGKDLLFVYDCPEMLEQGKPLHVFKAGKGGGCAGATPRASEECGRGKSIN